MAKRVLVISTSHEQLGDSGEKTGLWMEEVRAEGGWRAGRTQKRARAHRGRTRCTHKPQEPPNTNPSQQQLAHPYYIFKAHGCDVTVASVRGGEIPVDEASLNAPFLTPEVERFLLDDDAMKQVLDSTPLAAVADWADYDVVFLPGGHGACWDLAEDEGVRRVVEGLARAGRVVAAVCHGPVGLANARDTSGAPIVAGREVTGFSDAEEFAVAKEKVVPYSLEGRLKELGGHYTTAKDKWAPHALLDPRPPFALVTGQNPASSSRTAELVVEALGLHKKAAAAPAECEMASHV